MSSPVRHILLAAAMTGLVACSGSGVGLDGGVDATAPAHPEERASPVAESQDWQRPVQVFAGAEWYLARPEPEEEWRGVLHEREVEHGPAARSALQYTLVTEEQRLPVYAAHVEAKLAPFVGRAVVAIGKLVDLSDEGFGRELWLASIQVDAP